MEEVAGVAQAEIGLADAQTIFSMDEEEVREWVDGDMGSIEETIDWQICCALHRGGISIGEIKALFEAGVASGLCRWDDLPLKAISLGGRFFLWPSST